MAQKVLALCDSNIHYGSRLADYLEKQKGFPLRVVLFSDTEQFAQYVSGHRPSYLILSEDVFEKLPEKERRRAKKLFVLCRHAPRDEGGEVRVKGHSEVQEAGRGEVRETGRSEVRETGRHALRETAEIRVSEQAVYGEYHAAEIIRIYRYQPAGSIMRVLLSEFDEEDWGGPQAGLTGEGTKIIGVFTPIGRSMQTNFSVTLGQLLTKRGRTLYINLESWSGFRALLGRELKPDITDLMFFAEKEREQFMKQVEAMIDTIGSLEYIPPASAYMDLAAITQEQWIKVLTGLREDGRFAYLVLDVTEQIQGMLAVLKMCDLIYTIEGTDRIAKAKMYEYEKLLELMECDGIMQKTKKKRLPPVRFAEMDFSRMIYSELAGYVRRLIEEDFDGRPP